jgi:GMP synthase-like glutamine amidotransferase
MRLHYIQHAPYEPLGSIEDWARDRGSRVTRTLAVTDEWPSLEDIDWLVVMGGPMGAYEEGVYTWLVGEKRFIRAAIDAGKAVLGVCLGGQLVSEVLGGEVEHNPFKEVGWFTVTMTPEMADSAVFRKLPHSFVAGLWHGDTFSIPPGAERMASSEGCANQAFEFAEGRVVGLQFHPEWSREMVRALYERHMSDVAEGGPFVQTPEEILGASQEIYAANRDLLFALLDDMEFARSDA